MRCNATQGKKLFVLVSFPCSFAQCDDVNERFCVHYTVCYVYTKFVCVLGLAQ